MPPRRKGQFSAYALFRWFCRHLTIILGITPRTRRLLTKRCHRKVHEILSSTKYLQSPTNNNSDRQLGTRKSLLETDQRQIYCLLIENRKTVECIQRLLSKESRMIDLQELSQFIQSTTTKKSYGNASTMTDLDALCDPTTSCASLSIQSENVRRLKALEFIRRFIEMKKEDFCKHLINEEHLCEQKTRAIYQMITEFLRVVYQSEYEEEEEEDIIDSCSKKN